MNVAIRVNASEREGSGHFIRTLVFAKNIRKKNLKVYFLSNNLHRNFINLIKENNFKYINLKQSKLNYEKNDAIFTIKALKKINKIIDLLILDSYFLGISWEKKLVKFTKKLMVLDDKDREHFCHFYVSPLIKPKNYNIKYKNCKYFYGLKYLIIKPIKLKKNTIKSKNFLIYMGDSDRQNLSLKLIKILKKKIFKSYNFKVLIGNSNKSRLKILEASKKIKNISCLNFQKSLLKIYKKIDFAITGGGSITFEIIAAKVPTLVICQNLNQYNLIKNNNICNLNNIFKYKIFSQADLENFLKQKILLSKIKSNKIKFDFLGAKRILKHI